jgi:predicted nucleotidyltransferase
MKPTPYEDINNILQSLLKGLQGIFGENLLGFYLFGSLSYDDFNPDRSDMDLLVILHNSATQKEIDLIKQLHIDVEIENERWLHRIECSYVPKQMLKDILPPKLPRPYVGEGVFYPEAPYGNEWIINNYLLYKHGITLFGPDFKTLVKPIDIKDVQKASVKDLFKEWEPKLTDDKWLDNSHYQSYLVLNLCRILYTVLHADAGSKRVSAEWVKNTYPQWKDLIETAEQWNYGKKMKMHEETKTFLTFTIDQIKESKID